MASSEKTPLLATAMVTVEEVKSALKAMHDFKRATQSYSTDGDQKEAGPEFPKSYSESKAVRSLVLEPPTVPESIPSYEIHSELQKQGCQAFRFQEHVIVVAGSAAQAKERRGQVCTIRNETYRIEFANYHSEIFICPDVLGSTTDEVLHGFDRLPVAGERSIEVFRQSGNGPLMALRFSDPPKDTFVISIKVLSNTLYFKRSSSLCLVCNGKHEIITCSEVYMERVREPMAPGGQYVIYEQRVRELSDELEKVAGHDARLNWKKQPSKEIMHASKLVHEWKRMQETMQQLSFKRLGYTHTVD